jgi:hypothetical protein
MHVWNGDETACFYQLAPDKTHADKNEKLEGMKLSKKKSVYEMLKSLE